MCIYPASSIFNWLMFPHNHTSCSCVSTTMAARVSCWVNLYWAILICWLFYISWAPWVDYSKKTKFLHMPCIVKFKLWLCTTLDNFGFVGMFYWFIYQLKFCKGTSWCMVQVQSIHLIRNVFRFYVVTGLKCECCATLQIKGWNLKICLSQYSVSWKLDLVTVLFILKLKHCLSHCSLSKDFSPICLWFCWSRRNLLDQSFLHWRN